MRELARRPESDRRDLFRATAQAMRVHEAVVEKDFWVCWTLDYLFQDSPWQSSLAFKGGTSLSKAFGAIERFSEDIDLVLDWKVLGYRDDEPWEQRSVNKQDAFGKEANRRTAQYLADHMLPALRTGLSQRLGCELSATADGQTLLVHYPRAFSLDAIRPQIRLEVGPLASWIPNEARDIRPYAAEHFLSLFTVPSTAVRTIIAERTFWEKATILHQEAHRGPDRELPQHYARHYYDLYRLSLLPVGQSALQRLDLLQDVVIFKMRFYHCAWAQYETARPGTLRLLPADAHREKLRADYRAMQPMLFGSVPTFDAIMAGLTQVEQMINRPSEAHP